MRIKEKHPEFHLTWMTDSMYAGIVRAQPWVDGVIEWNRKNTGNRGYREIVKKIESEMEYPGQIKVNVIRETRSVEFAK